MHAFDSFEILKHEKKIKMKTRSGKKLNKSPSGLRVKKNPKKKNKRLLFSSKHSYKNPGGSSNTVNNLNKSPIKTMSFCIRIEKLNLNEFNKQVIKGKSEIDTKTADEQNRTTIEVSNESNASSISIIPRDSLQRSAKQQTKREMNQTTNSNSNKNLPAKPKTIALKRNEKGDFLKVVEVGQNVLAKQKYSVPWPAKVVAIRSKSVDVYFYGDGRCGPVKRIDIFSIPN